MCKYLLMGVLFLFGTMKASFGGKSLEECFPNNDREIESLVEQTLAYCQEEITKIIKLSEHEQSFESVVKAYDHINEVFGSAVTTLYILQKVHPNLSLVKKMRSDMSKLFAFSAAREIYLPKESQALALYKIIQRLERKYSATAELDSEQQILLKKIVQGLQLDGCALSGDDFSKFRAISQQVSDLERDFEDNITQDNTCVALLPLQLKGISENFLQRLNKDELGNFIVRLNNASTEEVLRYCEVALTRKTVFEAFSNRAFPANVSVLEKLRNLRHQQAAMVGFPSFAHYELADKMIGNPEGALDFLASLVSNISEKLVVEFESFKKDLPESVVLDEQGRFFAWDIPYVIRLFLEKHLKFSETEAREYFSVDMTIDAFFKIYQEAFDLKFELINNPVGVWDPNVKLVKVRNKKDNVVRGFIYLDLYARQGKYSHTYCCSPKFSMVDESSGAIMPSVSLMITNFTPPDEKGLSFLSWSEVKSLSHMFGLALHVILGSRRYYLLSGLHVKKDFVQCPSQLFEYWIQQPEILKKVSRHYQTGEPMPDELINKISVLEKASLGYFMARQAFNSYFPLMLFGSEKWSLDDLTKWCHQATFARFVSPAFNNHFYTSFGHLAFCGARYYCYPYARIMALDLFEELKKEGLFSATSRAKLQRLLTAGGSVESNDLLQEILGRPFDQSVLMKFL